MKPILKFYGAVPYLAAVFLNAMVDLGHKVLLQNTLLKLLDGSELVLWTAIVNSLILLPFVLLLSPASFITDRFAKHYLLRYASFAAFILTVFITFFYYMGWFWMAFGTTLLLASQSAIYGPAKGAYLKLLFGKERLAEANGMSWASAIIAILAGSLLFSIGFEQLFDPSATTPSAVIKIMAPIGWLLIASSLLQCYMCWRLPKIDSDNPEKLFPKKEYITGQLTLKNFMVLRRTQGLWLAVIGLSMFWGLGQTLLATFPAFAKETMGIDDVQIIQGVMASTGLGIALGSMFAGKVSRGYIETGLIPLGAIGITAGLWLVPNMSSMAAEALCFLLIGFSGGIFIVPLNSLIQYFANEDDIGQVMAANNWVQNIAMLTLLVMVSVCAELLISSTNILYIAASIAIVGSLYTVYQLPQSLIRFVLSSLLQRRYKMSVEGMRNIPETGGILLLGNHVSWIDWAIVQIACPRPIRFVMAKQVFDSWYLRPILKFFGCIPINQGETAEASSANVANLLNQGYAVCLFPEGGLSRTGDMLVFRRGFERACQLANDDVKIVPFYLRGLWGSQFSYVEGNLKQAAKNHFKRELLVGFGKPLPRDVDAVILKQKMFNLSSKTWQQHADKTPNLGRSLIQGLTRKRFETVLHDPVNGTMSGSALLAKATLLSRQLKKLKDQNIGLLLPHNGSAAITLLACLLAKKTPIVFPLESNAEALQQLAILTDVTFFLTVNDEVKSNFFDNIGASNAELKQLEMLTIDPDNLCSNVSAVSSFLAHLATKILPKRYFWWRHTDATVNSDSAALILFTPDTKIPVQLSHNNLLSNVRQITEVLCPNRNDRLISQLPLSQGFGLTVTLLLPLIEGVIVHCQPQKSDAKKLAKHCVKYQADYLFTTPNQLEQLISNDSIHALFLSSLRQVVSDSALLDQKIGGAFKLKFSLSILQSYGTTETSSVATVNIPDHLVSEQISVQLANRPGSVGMPLPGTSIRIVHPETKETLKPREFGQVCIAGPQVMIKYYNQPKLSQACLFEKDDLRWFLSRDRGYLDNDGFLWLVAN